MGALTLYRAITTFLGTMSMSLSERSRAILRHVVEAYVETGSPVGSRTISSRLGLKLSPATIRKVMADLEECGLLYAPHTSAGRLPTETGLQLVVNGLLEFGDLTEGERIQIETKCAASGLGLSEIFREASTLLSGLSHCAGLVMAPNVELILKHIEFISLGPGRVLVVLVSDSGLVENRVIDVPLGMPASSLVEASNYLAAKLVGRTLVNTRDQVRSEIKEHRVALDELTKRVVEAGLATWSDTETGNDGVLIVRGQANLLEDVVAVDDIERIRSLFMALETKEAFLRLLEATEGAEGVQIFIGSENELFGLAGCATIVAPILRDGQEKIIGAIGVIGPTRINYSRIVPMVDYTARIISQLLE